MNDRMSAVLADERRSARANAVSTLLGVGVILLAFAYAGVFDAARYRGALTTILTLLGDATPPDFSRWGKWGKPLVETQVLPRLMDATIYRWEHNVRAATTLGVVGAGGLGLEIVTAFHLFEYREAAALVLVLLVTVLNGVSAWLRRRFLGVR